VRFLKTQGEVAAFRMALLYTLFAGAWIFFSDWLLAWLVTDLAWLVRLETYKGWAFVAVTAVLLYFVLQRRLRALEEAHGARLAAQARERGLAERLQHYLAASPTVIYALKVEGGAARPVWVSENIRPLLGYPPEEALQPGWWAAHLHPEDRERVLANQSLLLEAGSLAHEYRFFHKDGRVLWVRDELRMVSDAAARDGQGQEIVGAWTDITALKEKEKEKQRAARSFRMLSRCNEAIALAEEEGALTEEICRLLVEEGGYRMAWVGFAEEEPGKRVLPVAQAGFEAGYLEAISVTWDDAETGRGPTGTAISSGQPVVCRNMLADPAYVPWRSEATRRGYASSIALPLADEKGTFGALNIYAAEPDAFDSDEVDLLGRLANTLSLGINKLRDRGALKKSENRYRGLFERATDVIFLVDARGRIRDCNPAACAVLGYDRAEMLTKNLQDLISPEDLAVEPLRIDQALGKPLSFKRKFRRKDGTLIITEARVTKLESGLLLGIVRDITGQVRAEETLRESERLLRESQELAGIGNYVLDIPAGTWKSSAVLADILGINRKDEHSLEEWSAVIHPDWREHVLRAREEALEKGAQFRQEYKIIRKSDGEERWVYQAGKIERDEKGNPVRMIGTILDITARRENEEEIRARHAELAALYELSTHIRAAKSSADLLPIVLDNVRRLLRAAAAAVTLVSPDRTRFIITLGAGLWEDSTGRTFPADRGLCGLVLDTGKPYVSEDYGAEARALPLEGGAEKEIGPAAFVPLKSEEELLGVLAVASRREPGARTFTPAEMHLLTAVGEMVGNALRRMQLYEEAARRLRQTQALRNIDMAITGSLDLRVTFRVILDEVTGQLGVDAAAILRRDPYTGTLRYEAWRGFHAVSPEHLSLRLNEGYAGRAALERRALFLPDLREAEPDPAQGHLLAGEGFAAYYAVPLIAKGHVQGVLEVFRRKPAVPDGEWLEFLETLAGQAAVAIDDAELFHRLERANVELTQAYDLTLEGWAYALDLKDEETEGHSRRVTEMTLRIAREMGLTAEELAHIRRGALLHDIGKMGIPDAILLKPGSLTDEEWEIMRRHPVYAYQMLSRIDYLRPALDIPYCHHEKWDGTGYPRGLKGEEIPLAARIFAVVDAYDALTSDRPYRPAWPKEKALAYLREQAGRHFDPRVVEVFLQILEPE